MIQYPGGVFDNRSVVVGAAMTTDLAATIALSLTAAGWTVTDLSQYDIIESNGAANLNNNDTVTINALVYTFKTVIGAPAREILIGGTVKASLQNLAAAINAAAGSGTLYSAATVINPDVTAIMTPTQNNNTAVGFAALWIHTKSALGLAVSETSALNAWNNATLASTLRKAVSVETPAFQKMTIYFGATPATISGTSFSIAAANRDNTDWGGARFEQGIVNGQTWRVLAHRYGFHSHLVGSYNGTGTSIYAQNPYLFPFISPKKITNATNATPIVITTSAAHGYVDGDTVIQKYVAGNTAANGTFTITYINTTQYSLVASAGNGGFSGSLGLAQNLTPPRKEVMEHSYVSIGNPGATNGNWGTEERYYFNNNSAGDPTFCILDGGIITAATGALAQFPETASYNNAAALGEYTWASGAGVALEPIVVFDVFYGGARAAAAQIYGAFVSSDNTPGGATFTADGHNWYGVYNNDARGQLYLMTS